MTKLISRDILIVVFKNDSFINFVDIKNLNLIRSFNLGSKIINMETCLLPLEEELENQNLKNGNFDIEILNFRQKYLLISDANGFVNILNTNTLEIENRFNTCNQNAQNGQNKPVICSLTTYYDYCLMVLDAELTLKLYEITSSRKIELKRSYNLSKLIKTICDYSGRKISILSLESSPVIIKKVGFDHIAISIAKSLHIFKTNSKFQLKHIASFFSLTSAVVPYSTDQVLDDTNGTKKPISYQTNDKSDILSHEKNSNLSCLFYVKGCFYEYDLKSEKLLEICKTKMIFGRLQLLEYSTNTPLGSFWRFLNTKSDGSCETFEIMRKT